MNCVSIPVAFGAFVLVIRAPEVVFVMLAVALGVRLVLGQLQDVEAE